MDTPDQEYTGYTLHEPTIDHTGEDMSTPENTTTIGSPEYIEAFTKDFLIALDGLNKNENYQQALSFLAPIEYDFDGVMYKYLDISNAQELTNTTSLPGKWKTLLSQLIEAIKRKKIDPLNIDEKYASTPNYDCSPEQALHLLITAHQNNSLLLLNIQHFPKFVALSVSNTLDTEKSPAE